MTAPHATPTPESETRTAMASLRRALWTVQRDAEEIRSSLQRIAEPGEEMRRFRAALRVSGVEAR